MSGAILGSVDTSVGGKTFPVLMKLRHMAIVFPETSTESYQPWGMCDFSPS